MNNRESDDKRKIVMSEIMTPDKANFSGHVHGGHLMQLMDKVAYACASRYASNYVVTLSADQILFKQPVFVGELVTFYACVNYIGTSSMEVGIQVVAENLIKGTRRHTNTCYFTMVAVNEKGKPVKVTQFTPTDQIDQYRWEEAKKRKQTRMEYQDKHQRHKDEVRKGA